MKTITNDANNVNETHEAALKSGKDFLTGNYQDFNKCISDIETSNEEYLREDYVGVEYNTCKISNGGVGSVLKGYRDIAVVSFGIDFRELLTQKLLRVFEQSNKIGFFLSDNDTKNNSFNLILFRSSDEGRKNAVFCKKYMEKMPNTKEKEISQLESLGRFSKSDINKYCSYRYILRTCETYGELFRYPPEEVKAFYEKINKRYTIFSKDKNMPCISGKEYITAKNINTLLNVTDLNTDQLRSSVKFFNAKTNVPVIDTIDNIIETCDQALKN